MSSFPVENDVLEACQILFGAKIVVSRDFLFYLQPSGAKTAYRRKAKETHPDLYQGGDPEILQQQADTFREVTQAYELVSLFLREREKHLEQVPTPHLHRREDTTSRPPSGASSSSPSASASPPSRELEIGLFLYYRKVISSRMLAEALIWQRRQRAAFGEVAHRWGWLTDADLERISVTRIPFSRFGERAVHLGLLTPAQVRTLLFYQRARQKRLGEFFIERGLLSRQEMDQHVEDLRRHNARIRSGVRDENSGASHANKKGPSRKDRP
jgi:curved DNA-binding protein CbpA